MTFFWSRAGSFHSCQEDKNQDRVMSAENERFTVITLADGASSCPESGTGAEIACEAVTALFLSRAEMFFGFNRRETADFVLGHIRHRIKKRAEAENRCISDYSSTIASVICDSRLNRFFYFSLGDSLIAGTDKSRCFMIAMPPDSFGGTCMTTTENAEKLAECGVVQGREVDTVFICSDGAWRLMFERNRLYKDMERLLVEGDFKGLSEAVVQKESFDDHSLICCDMSRRIIA